MFKIASIVAVATAVLFSSTAAQAVVLDYNAGALRIETAVTEKGFTTTALGALAAVANYNWCNPQCSSNGSNYFMTYYAAGFSVKSVTGAAFNLTSFDAAEVFTNFAGAPTLQVTGYKVGGGTVIQSFTLDGINDGLNGLADFQTFSLANFGNLSLVTFAAAASRPNFALDNVNVSLVPEPGTVALFGLGLVGIAAVKRRQQA